MASVIGILPFLSTFIRGKKNQNDFDQFLRLVNFLVTKGVVIKKTRKEYKTKRKYLHSKDISSIEEIIETFWGAIR